MNFSNPTQKLVLAIALVLMSYEASAQKRSEIPYDAKWRTNIIAAAARLKIDRIQSFDVGLYGKYKYRTVFFADISVVPDYDRLYWIMIKVLSEKYGCFVTNKKRTFDQFLFHCKDDRFIKMTRGRVGRIMHFYGTQYDGAGQLIENKDLVRNTR